MATNWYKSLQCKSRAFDDVYHSSHKPLLPSPSCRNSYQNLKDVIDKPKPKPKPKPMPMPTLPRRSSSVKPKPKPDPISSPANNRVKRTLSAPITKPEPFFPTVSELQVGHPSRNVVEIIFHTRWSPKGFSGRVETVLKIQNMVQTVSQFEQYRDSVKSRAGAHTARCSADGNEMMRFRCLGPTTTGGVVIDGGVWPVGAGKGPTPAAICTYSGSGAAHESAGGGRGRRAMLVCRVIAGRVGSEPDGHSGKAGGLEFDSVSRENGELLVFDNRAVLPCFLVIYKL